MEDIKNSSSSQRSGDGKQSSLPGVPSVLPLSVWLASRSCHCLRLLVVFAKLMDGFSPLLRGQVLSCRKTLWGHERMICSEKMEQRGQQRDQHSQRLLPGQECNGSRSSSHAAEGTVPGPVRPKSLHCSLPWELWCWGWFSPQEPENGIGKGRRAGHNS